MQKQIRWSVTTKSEKLISSLVDKIERLTLLLCDLEKKEAFLENNPEVTEALNSMLDNTVEYYEEIRETTYPLKDKFELILTHVPSTN